MSESVSHHPSTLVWLRHDLRIHDNPALYEAVKRDRPVVVAYVHDEAEDHCWRAGAASRWWLDQSLRRLDADLRLRGNRLTVRVGRAGPVLASLAEECGAETILWNRRYRPDDVERDTAAKSFLKSLDIEVRSLPGDLLFEPWIVENRSHRPFQVFTPFYRHCLGLPEPARPRTAPERIPAPSTWPMGASIDSVGLLPAGDWAAGLRATWSPGEAGGRRMLDAFVDEPMRDYPDGRNLPGLPGTSRLSPHLHFGEVGPRQIWHACSEAALHGPARRIQGATAYLRQLLWREFAHHLLYHVPYTADQPLREGFAKFPWRTDGNALRAWQRGRTGYPMVDAGMRQLWEIGWMHNRVRMIVASFLVKHLLLPWIDGARWFWDTLVDADLANNTLGWQWAAGCGADAAPYYRIFNPMRQGQRFDSGGDYVRRWVPELAGLTGPDIHQPWQASKQTLANAGIRLGDTYPMPIVEHQAARSRALEALAVIKKDRA